MPRAALLESASEFILHAIDVPRYSLLAEVFLGWRDLHTVRSGVDGAGAFVQTPHVVHVQKQGTRHKAGPKHRCRRTIANDELAIQTIPDGDPELRWAVKPLPQTAHEARAHFDLQPQICVP